MSTVTVAGKSAMKSVSDSQTLGNTCILCENDIGLRVVAPFTIIQKANTIT